MFWLRAIKLSLSLSCLHTNLSHSYIVSIWYYDLHRLFRVGYINQYFESASILWLFIKSESLYSVGIPFSPRNHRCVLYTFQISPTELLLPVRLQNCKKEIIFDMYSLCKCLFIYRWNF